MSKEAGKLIIENIGAIEEAYLLLTGELSEQVFQVVNQTIETWAKKMDWEGEFSFSEEKGVWDTWFAPENWQEVAKFEVDAMDDYGEAWLTALLGAWKERACFSFTIDYRSIGFNNVASWRRFALQQNENLSAIEKAGFQFDARNGSWSLPWKIDAEALAQGYVNDTMEDAMGPLMDALGRIESVSDAFDSVVNAARQQAA